MWRSILAFLFCQVTAAAAAHLVFTTLTHPTCPVLVSAPMQSPDYGFQSLMVRNDSDQTIEKLYIQVVLSTPKSREEIVDSGHVYVTLEPGDSKRLDVFLGRLTALNQRMASSSEPVAWVKLYVDSAEFADGTRWDPHGTVTDSPGVPILPPK